MYRASHDSLASTIARLDDELRTLHALRAPARPAERTLWVVTAVSVLVAVLAGAALVSLHDRAEDAERRFEGARVRLEQKTKDLGTCEALGFHELAAARD